MGYQSLIARVHVPRLTSLLNCCSFIIFVSVKLRPHFTDKYKLRKEGKNKTGKTESQEHIVKGAMCLSLPFISKL